MVAWSAEAFHLSQSDQMLRTVHQKLSLFNKNASYDQETGKIEYSFGDSFEIVEVSKKQALENQVEYFVACLKEGNKPQNNEVAALQVMQLLESINNTMHA